MSEIQFRATTSKKIQSLVQAWQNQLLIPHDDMWLSFCESAKTIEILVNETSIGFASINDEGQLIRCLIEDEELVPVSRVMRQMKEEGLFNAAIVGTHDTASLHAVSRLGGDKTTHTLLFELKDQDQLQSCEPLTKATAADLDRVVDYYHHTIQAPVEWLKGYVGERIIKQEFYFLEKDDTIQGSCEVRAHSYSVQHASIGMAVNPDFRRLGLGTKLLGAAASMALAVGKQPICSTEVENIGSIKAIEANAFRSDFQLVEWII